MINKERKEEMKMKRLIKASTLLMAAALFAACANEDITQPDKENEALKGSVIFTTNGPKISAKRLSIDGEEEFVGAKTRTTITHTPGQGADVYWTNDDFIWVLNRNNQWKKSRNIILHDGGASAEFRLRGSASDYKDGCVVVYSKWGTALSTSIPAYQPQTTPNNFNSAGDWGDCGMGVARNTGNALRDLGRYQEAITAYQQALELFRQVNGTQRQQAYCLNEGIGNTLHRMGRPDEAATAYQQAQNLDPNLNGTEQSPKGSPGPDIG